MISFGDSGDGDNGLWSTIIGLCPAPERREIKLMIGSQLVDETERLWLEMRTLSQIASQAMSLDAADRGTRQHLKSHSSALPNPSINNSITKSNNGPKGSVSIPPLTLNSSSLQSARLQSNVTGAAPSCHSSARSSDADDDFVSSIKDDLCLDRIKNVAQSIRAALKEEKFELEQEINSLTELLNSEADKICATPRRCAGDDAVASGQVCLHCGRKRQQIQSTITAEASDSIGSVLLTSKSAGPAGFPMPVKQSKYICSLCKDKDRKLRKSQKDILPGTFTSANSFSRLGDNSSKHMDDFGYDGKCRDEEDNRLSSGIDSKSDAEIEGRSLNRMSASSAPSATVVSKSKSIGFRDKLQAARDEKYFMDD